MIPGGILGCFWSYPTDEETEAQKEEIIKSSHRSRGRAGTRSHFLLMAMEKETEVFWKRKSTLEHRHILTCEKAMTLRQRLPLDDGPVLYCQSLRVRQAFQG